MHSLAPLSRHSGANYGWYTLFSIAMGCTATVVEPIPAYQSLLRFGLSLNPGFQRRAKLYSNVVYPHPGVYNVSLPLAAGGGAGDASMAHGRGTQRDAEGADGSGGRRVPPSRRVRRGMAGMQGAHGVLKKAVGQPHTSVAAHAISIDEISAHDSSLCALKIDVEGYEPQALQSAAKLLARAAPVPVLQLELNKFHNDSDAHREQMCATEKTLMRLEALGYRFREVPSFALDRPLNISSPGYKKQLAQEQRHLSRAAKQAMTWRSIVQPGAPSWEAEAIFPVLPQFPSVDVRSGVAMRGHPEERAIVLAYREFRSYSTNLVGVYDSRLRKPGAAEAPWPAMGCGGVPGD